MLKAFDKDFFLNTRIIFVSDYGEGKLLRHGGISRAEARGGGKSSVSKNRKGNEELSKSYRFLLTGLDERLQ